MKKINFLLSCSLVAALALTSCSLNEDVNKLPEETPIAFDTYVGRDAQTKGHIEYVAGIQTHGFGVFAYYCNESPDKDHASANFMNNVKVSGANWSYAPTKYWPKQGNIDFIAYAPYYAGSGSDPVVFDYPKATFSVNSTVANQVDFLVATSIADQNGGKQSFSFNHVLSRIEFWGETNIPESETTTIHINEITVSGNFYQSRTIDMTNCTWETPNPDTKISTTYLLTNGTEFVNKKLIPTSTALNKDNENYIFMIPDVTPRITVNYTIKSQGSDDITLDYAFDGSKLEKGKAYKYNLKVTLTGIEFEATVSEWNTNLDDDNATNDDINADLQ